MLIFFIRGCILKKIGLFFYTIFYTFKCAWAVVSKEERGVATADPPGFFLRTEIEGDERMLLKLTVKFALLLIESDPNKQIKHLMRENGKWVLCATCNKTMYRTMIATLISCEKLAMIFKEWSMIMSMCDPCAYIKDVDQRQMIIIIYVGNFLMASACSQVEVEQKKGC